MKNLCFETFTWEILWEPVVYLSDYYKRMRNKKNADRKGKDYKGYHPESLEQAVQAVLEGKMNGRQAAKLFGVPIGTVYDRVAKR